MRNSASDSKLATALPVYDRQIPSTFFTCDQCSSPPSFVLGTALGCNCGGDELLVKKNEAFQKRAFLRLEDLGRSSDAG